MGNETLRTRERHRTYWTPAMKRYFYDNDVIKGRYTSLWNQFNDVKNMLGDGGFSWDAIRHMVVADDYVWETYVKGYLNPKSLLDILV
nr:hypothetical protein [Tanacetum cinerariifolium]